MNELYTVRNKSITDTAALATFVYKSPPDFHKLASPFGLRHKPYTASLASFAPESPQDFPALARPNAATQQGYKYQYNDYGGKSFEKAFDEHTARSAEFQDELGLNMLDFHARLYDPAIGRTTTFDPHMENYMSLSPYSFFGNNPLVFKDPSGKDLIFYRWDEKKEEYVEATFDELDEQSQKALEAFAKTDVGKGFLSLFAKKGDNVGSVEFDTDGFFSDNRLEYVYNPRSSVIGQAYTQLHEGATSFTKRVTISKPSMGSVAEEALTIGHETILHDWWDTMLIGGAYSTTQMLCGGDQDCIKGEYVRVLSEMFDQYNDNAKQNGSNDHWHYKYNTKTHVGNREFRKVLNQLKGVLNPKEVQKAIDEHLKLFDDL